MINPTNLHLKKLNQRLINTLLRIDPINITPLPYLPILNKMLLDPLQHNLAQHLLLHLQQLQLFTFLVEKRLLTFVDALALFVVD